MGRHQVTDSNYEDIQKCLNCTKERCTNCLARPTQDGPRLYNRCHVLQFRIGSRKPMAVYDSAQAAEKETGINCKSIYRCMRGETHSAGGYAWKSIPVR